MTRTSPSCPRCGKHLQVTHYEQWCVCGFSRDDVLDPNEAAVKPVLPARYFSYHEPSIPRWTKREIEEWETWREGDPLPEWAVTVEGVDADSPKRVLTDEWRKKIAIARRGKKHTMETRAKISEANKRRKNVE